MELFLHLEYWGIFFASFLAATVLPFSSEVILSTMIATGFDIELCIAFATMGNWLGSLSSYYLGRLGKWRWLEKYFSVKESKVLVYKSRIEKYSYTLAFLTWLPFIGDILAVGLGYFRIPFVPCAVFIFIGKITRYTVWALLTVNIFS